MKKTMKRILAIMLVVVMTIGIAPLSGLVGLELPTFGGFKKIEDSVSEFFDSFGTKAEATTSGTCGDNLIWEFDESTGTLTISGTGDMYDWDVSIPPWLAYRHRIQSVKICSGVTSIGNYAFSKESYSSLKYIIIPDSVIRIGNFAFSGCNNLTNITIPNGIVHIGNNAFDGCVSLSKVTMGNSIISIGKGAFKECVNLIDITIPDSVTYIGSYAFMGCENLTKAIIGNSVTNIGDSVFYGCKNLINISIGDSVTSIGNDAFAGCISLPNVVIGDNVTSIGNEAFHRCTSLKSITIGNSVTSIGDHAFYFCESLQSVYIPDSVICIGHYAFYGCKNLTKISIGDGVTGISQDMFAECNNLTSVIIGNGVKVIPNNMFSGREKLTSVIVGNSVTMIADYAFWNCINLKEITIPKIVTNIGNYVFYNCTNLENIYYYGTEEQWNAISIGTNNQTLINSIIYYNYVNTDQEQTNKLSVFTNNMSLSYFKGDKVYFSVTEIEDGIWNIPENIVVTSSDNSILKFEQMGKKDWFKHFLIGFAPTKYDKLKSYMSAIIPEAFEDCKFICFEAINPGNAVVTITNNDTGEKVEIPISVADDEYYSLRADRVPENFLGSEVEYDTYNYNVNGMMVTDFECTKVENEYNFKMNIYNRKYSSGVVEVYDGNGNLFEVYKISGRDASTTGLVETFEAGWGLVKSISDYNMLSFRAPHQTKHTPIDIMVPQDGGIIITNDSAASTSCCLFNLFDAALSSRSLISDVKSFSTEQIDIIEKKLLANLIADKVRMEFADNTKEKIANLVIDNISESTVKSLIKSIDQIIYEFMQNLDIDLNEICKTAIKETGGELIEDIFGKYAGPAGAAINGLYLGESFHEYYNKLRDWSDTIGSQSIEGIVTPLDKDYEEGLINSIDGISVDAKNNVPSGTVLQTIRLYDGYNELNIRKLSTEYVIRDYKTYDISLVRNGERVQPSGKVELYIPVPSGFTHVRAARQNDDGTWTFLNTKVRDGIAIIEVDHFCVFVILDVDEDEKTNPALAIVLPSTTTINYGDSIWLHAEIEGDLPAGVRIIWTPSDNNFEVVEVLADGMSCKITPVSSGTTTFTVSVVDADKNVLSTDTQDMTAKAGLWQKIVAFFKKIFGATKTYPEVFKSLF